MRTLDYPECLTLGFKRERKTADGSAKLSAKWRHEETPVKTEPRGCAVCISAGP